MTKVKSTSVLLWITTKSKDSIQVVNKVLLHYRQSIIVSLVLDRWLWSPKQDGASGQKKKKEKGEIDWIHCAHAYCLYWLHPVHLEYQIFMHWLLQTSLLLPNSPSLFYQVRRRLYIWSAQLPDIPKLAQNF